MLEQGLNYRFDVQLLFEQWNNIRPFVVDTYEVLKMTLDHTPKRQFLTKTDLLKNFSKLRDRSEDAKTTIKRQL